MFAHSVKGDYLKLHFFYSAIAEKIINVGCVVLTHRNKKIKQPVSRVLFIDNHLSGITVTRNL